MSDLNASLLNDKFGLYYQQAKKEARQKVIWFWQEEIICWQQKP